MMIWRKNNFFYKLFTMQNSVDRSTEFVLYPLFYCKTELNKLNGAVKRRQLTIIFF